MTPFWCFFLPNVKLNHLFSYLWTVPELMATRAAVETQRFGSAMNRSVVSSFYIYPQHCDKNLASHTQWSIFHLNLLQTFCLSFLFQVHLSQWPGWKPVDSFAEIQEFFIVSVPIQQDRFLSFNMFNVNAGNDNKNIASGHFSFEKKSSVALNICITSSMPDRLNCQFGYVSLHPS